MTQSLHRALACGLVTGLVTTVSVLGLVGPAAAEPSGEIDFVETANGVVQVLFSLRDLPKGITPELATVEVSIDDEAQTTTAERASNAGDSVQRSTVLAIDVSNSMAGDRFAAARNAALTFINEAPDDLSIGLVSFADKVTQVQAPTTNRDAVRAAVEQLRLEEGTLLYQGIEQALDVLADEGSGNVVVLSDGRDTGGEPITDVLTALRTSEARIDVVALEQSGTALRVLEQLAVAGSGQVINADAASLTAVLSAQAAELESQVLISFDVPEDWDGGDATLSAAISAAGVTYSDEALVKIPAAPSARKDTEPTTLEAAGGPLISISRPLMLGGLAALTVGGLVIALLLSNTFSGHQRQRLDVRLSPYAEGQPGTTAATQGRNAPSYSPSVRQQAVEFTGKAMGQGVDVSLSRRLDAAGLKINSAEWLLLHAGVAVGAAAVGFLISGGRLLLTGILFLLGSAGPWVYLSIKRSRRLKAFNGQLADTLQLIAGSLSAGLSLAQSLDTVVREGNEPVAGEFRRALVEQRLGVEIETALEGVAERMGSDDFAWVVMAIRVQRQVGGNLAELLTTVAATLREREYLRRQVSVLSAEGRLSALILGAWPPLFVIYLAMARPTYWAPMYTTQLGLV
ncbi:MAG: type II secretion system F family protein, partial [Nocardioidaceae bacterium]